MPLELKSSKMVVMGGLFISVVLNLLSCKMRGWPQWFPTLMLMILFLFNCHVIPPFSSQVGTGE